MCAPLARNHTFSRNVCPSYTKPYFSKKCVPLLHETILFCKSTEIRTRGYVNNSRNLPTSRTQRTQGRNIPVQENPSLRYTDFSFFVFLSTCLQRKKSNFLVRFLSIHPVQSVVNSPTQLSGRGFARICHMKLFSSQLYVFLVLPNGSRAV